MAADYGSRALTARDYSRALTERLPAHERMRTPHNMLDFTAVQIKAQIIAAILKTRG